MSAFDALKSGFGYTKASVCQYITQLNQDFSKRITEKDLAHENTVRELNARLERLEKENLRLREKQAAVSDAIIDAKHFSFALKEEAEEENRKSRLENAARNQAEQRRIYGYRQDIDKIRDALKNVLENIDSELDKIKSETDETEKALRENTSHGEDTEKES